MALNTTPAGLFAFLARALGPAAKTLQDAAVTSDRSDQDRLGSDLSARKDDALPQLSVIADGGAVSEHHRAHQTNALADAHISADPHRSFNLGSLRRRLPVGDDHTRAELLALDVQAQLAAQRVERPLPELAQRTDVVPVLVHLVDMKGHVVLQQHWKDILCPVHEWPRGKVVEDLWVEHVDAAVAEIRQRLLGRRLLLKARDTTLAIV